jgi:hypothetical protein
MKTCGDEVDDSVMVKDLLIRKATVADWENESLFERVPLGYCNREWEALKAKMEPGDEVWFWSTDEDSWNRMMGWRGWRWSAMATSSTSS